MNAGKFSEFTVINFACLHFDKIKCLNVLNNGQMSQNYN